MLLLLAHELGHYFAFRAYGLPARLPAFVPLLGAFTAGTPPEDLEHDAYIALAGPLTGLGLAAVCYAIGAATHDRFWYACADLSAFLNLFNMIPTPPFDGGRVIGALWPPLWIVGFAIFIALAILWHIPLLFIVIIGALGLPAMIAAWRGHVDPRAARMTFAARGRVSVWYLATLLGLLVVMAQAHAIATPGSGAPDLVALRFLALAYAAIAIALVAARPAATAGPLARDFEAYWSAGVTANAGADPYSRRIWKAESSVAGVDRRRDELLPFIGPPATLLVWRRSRACRTRPPLRSGSRCLRSRCSR